MSTFRDRPAIWWSGLVVLIAAAVATAHGLYVVAERSGVPEPVAALYPLMTDGLALVAYLSTRSMRRAVYPWAVVLLAAGVSGVAQGVLLSGGLDRALPGELRFGVGAWPATSAMLSAHLIHLASRGTARVRVDAEAALRAELAALRDSIPTPVSVDEVRSGVARDVLAEFGGREVAPAGPTPEEVQEIAVRSAAVEAQAAVDRYISTLPTPGVPDRLPTRTPGTNPRPGSRTPGSKTERMREFWDRERAAGRTPSLAEMDRAAGTNGHAKALRPRWLAAEESRDSGGSVVQLPTRGGSG